MLNSARGFTLLEVMIAMAILAIALAAVFSSQSQSISMTADSRFATTAALLAQSKMVEYEAGTLREAVSASGEFGSDFPDYAWRVEVKDTNRDLLKKIEVTVTNRRLASNNTYRLTLYGVMDQS